MSFDPWNPSLKIWDSNSLKWKSTWECVGSFLHTPSHSWECKCESWVAYSACTFPCLCFGHEYKARVVTLKDGIWAYSIVGRERQWGRKHRGGY
jgi:hypothetical protein